MPNVLPLIPLGIIGIITWSLWGIRRLYGANYTPFQGSYTATTSAVVPVYMEDPAVLVRAIKSYLANNVGEVVLVVDSGDTVNIRNIQKNFPVKAFPNVKLIITDEPGKRPALAWGIREATGEIVVLSDSDTAWAPNLLDEILKPFIDSNVGGVGAKQNVEDFEKSIVWRIENWLLDLRYIDFVPGMSVDGVVNCLSGRTAAYRRSLLLPMLAELTGETFLGKTCIGGDDLRLTHLLLSRGYKTVYQSTAQARTVYSGRLNNFIRRKIRWSRNSYRGNLRAFWQGWVWRKSWILPVSMFHATITPYTLAIGGLATAYFALTSPGTVTTLFGVAFNFPLLWLVVSIGGRSFKGLSHLRQVPRDVSLAVIMTFLMLFIMVPVKIFSLVTMNRQGWVGTRNSIKPNI
ncbi:glycosyltransferase [Candidatus Bathyarchaeota archaeon]|nr:MAG: glycosyltransferase [Candidatus Bathyarchaeota archaeon]